ncbi:Transcriptional regulator, AraC family protein [Minicystis rosea]|nr:Transcriptional regulator, AraC family protein [Minicystis rosea]
MAVPLPARLEFMTAETSASGLRFAEAAYPPHLNLREHTHDKSGITILASGSFAEVKHRGRATDCEAGAVVVRPAGEPHGNRIGARGAVNLELEIDPPFLSARDLAIDRLSIFARPDASALASRVQAEMRVRDRAQPLLVEALALELLALVVRGVEAPRRESPPWLLRARDRLVSELGAETSIADLAREAGVHPVYFARAFRAAFGASPGQVRRASRLARAREALLRDPERPLVDIALEAGFYDQSHFARAFHAFAGVAPSAYRARATRRRA